jgi:hypothetical protein
MSWRERAVCAASTRIQSIAWPALQVQHVVMTSSKFVHQRVSAELARAAANPQRPRLRQPAAGEAGPVRLARMGCRHRQARRPLRRRRGGGTGGGQGRAHGPGGQERHGGRDAASPTARSPLPPPLARPHVHHPHAIRARRARTRYRRTEPWPLPRTRPSPSASRAHPPPAQ